MFSIKSNVQCVVSLSNMYVILMQPWKDMIKSESNVLFLKKLAYKEVINSKVILLTFWAASPVINSEKLKDDDKSFWIEVIAKPVGQDLVVVGLKYVVINFNFENERSADATVMGIVSKILRTITRFGTTSCEPLWNTCKGRQC